MVKDYNNTDELLDDLNSSFLTLIEYYAQIDNGTIVKKKLFENDRTFELLNPDHPLNAGQKCARMNAADTILYVAKHENKTLIPLNIINEHILDCCAAVRLALLTTLLRVGDKSSVSYVNQLKTVESESQYVKNYCNMVLDILEMESSFITDIKTYWIAEVGRILGFANIEHAQSAVGSAIYIGDVVDKKATGFGRLYDEYSGQLLYEGQFKANLFNGYGKSFKCEGLDNYQGEFIDGRPTNHFHPNQ